jgi:HEAT repeat protein
MTRRHGEIVTRGVLHLMKEGWRRFADGLVLFLAVCIFGHNLAAQTGTTSDWPETEVRLISQLSGDIEQKRSALFEIRNLQTKQASRLAISALKDTDEIVRATAASSVVYLQPSDAVTVLRPLLNDRSEFVRRETAYALGKTGNQNAAGQLLNALKNEKSSEVLTAIVAALGELGNGGVLEYCVKLLEKSPKEEDEFLRRSAARSVGQVVRKINIGETRALTPQNFLPEKFKDIEPRKYPNPGFAMFRDVVPVLVAVLSNIKESDDTRREAAFALGEIGDPSAIPLLRKGMSGSDPYLAEICKEALLKIEKPE